MRDLARLGLGRVAHEQYRFDDARYYYYLVPNDSERLPEALYESATSRYEAKDYDGARDLLDELRLLERQHAYDGRGLDPRRVRRSRRPASFRRPTRSSGSF